MSPSPATNAATAREWRELGFFYETDQAERSWRFIGSRSGLLQLPRLLRGYASNPRRADISEHDHYGPYFYLKIVTWHEPLITADDIRGTQPDIRGLADLIESHLVKSHAGQTFIIDADYSMKNEFQLHFRVRKDSFDPACADPLLPEYSTNEA